LWQWIRHERVSRAEIERVTGEVVSELPDDPVIADARELFERVSIGEEFEEFLTLPAYDRLLERE
jgi:malate synthase